MTHEPSGSLDAKAQILNIWGSAWSKWSVARTVDGSDADKHLPEWGDTQNPEAEVGRCSVLDAESLEALLLPQFAIDGMSLGNPSSGGLAPDVARALAYIEKKNSGMSRDADPKNLSRHLRRVLGEFLDHYEDAQGNPVFSSGPYYSFSAPGIENPPTVDDFTMSMSVCLHALHLCVKWRENIDRDDDDVRGAIRELEARLTRRLRACMDGLLASFAVNKDVRAKRRFGSESITRLEEMQRELRGMFPKTLKGLAVEFESAEIDEPVAPPFECGWSWGRVSVNQDLKERFWPDAVEDEAAVVAEGAPYLYFTLTALEGISDLADPRIRSTALREPEIAHRAQELLALAEITGRYWYELAIGDSPARWPVEDIPWSTEDNDRDDYWSLYILLAITSVESLVDRLESPEFVERLLLIAEELGQRARVTREPFPETDAMVRMHIRPGRLLELHDADENHVLTWSTYDFAPKLLKLAGRILNMSKEVRIHGRAQDLVDQIWAQHVFQRAADKLTFAWDYPENIKDFERLDWENLTPLHGYRDDVLVEFGSGEAPEVDAEQPVSSWYITERVVEALTAIELSSVNRPGTFDLGALAREMIADVRAQVRVASGLDPERATDAKDALVRANRSLAASDPASAIALALRASDEINGRR